MKYLLSLVVMTMGCAEATPNLCQVSTPGATITVHSYGDSITAGAGTGTYSIGNNVSTSDFCNGYQAIFTKDIKANGDDEAVSGSTFTSISEFPKITSLEAQSQDIITILPGFNDVSYFGSDASHLSLFENDLIQALTHLKNMGKMTLVGTTLYMRPDMQQAFWPMHTNSNVDLYVNTIKQIINQLQAQGFTNLYLVDTNAIFDPSTMTSTDFHPDNHGHEILAQSFEQIYEANK